LMAHAAFGLLNSTPHSVRPTAAEESRTVLRAMTAAALSVDSVEVSTSSAGRRPDARLSPGPTAPHRSPPG
jgi:hypothetical protein